MFFLPIPTSLQMKMAPSILQTPLPWSDSLYFYKGNQIQPNSSDAQAAEIYFRRVIVARAAITEQRTRWQRKLASDLASCTRWQRNPKPCVLKSKWAVKWDSLMSGPTPHQRVDMDLAKQIWELDVWKWKYKRISDGTSLRTGSVLNLWAQACMWNPFFMSAVVRHFFPCQQVCKFAAVLSMWDGQQVCGIFFHVSMGPLMRFFMSEGCLHKSHSHDIGCWLFSWSMLLHYLFYLFFWP